MDGDLFELLVNLVGCFFKRSDEDSDWYYTKTNDGEWVPVGEDLQEFLSQGQELLDGVED